MVEDRRRLAGFSLLGATDASETCSVVLSSGERALFFVLRLAVALLNVLSNFLIREGGSKGSYISTH